jgi:16S rRNA G527 N7-methylase RsmG
MNKLIEKYNFKLEPLIYDFSCPFYHFQMVKDYYRTKSYFDEIKKYVKDKVVIDFGAGSGILGVYAALCGAKYVYFVEIEEKMHAFIKKICELNKIKKYSIKKSYNECESKKIDVCISELVGHYHLECGLDDALKQVSDILNNNENCISIPESISLYAIQTYNKETEKEKKYLKKFPDVNLPVENFLNNNNQLLITSKNKIFKKFGDKIFLKKFYFRNFHKEETIFSKKIKLEKKFNCLNFGWELNIGEKVFLKHFPNNNNNQYSNWKYVFVNIDGDCKEYELNVSMDNINICKCDKNI